MKFHFFLLLLLLNSQMSKAQTLAIFEYSECLTDCCVDSLTSVDVSKRSDIMQIEFGSLAPCNGNLRGDFHWKSDTLDLTFETKPTVYKRKDGSTYEILEIADCNCYFRFKYEITNPHQFDIDKLLVNGEPIHYVSKKLLRLMN